MYFGMSGCQGVMLGKHEKEETKAVYGYYENNEIVLVEDKYENIKKLQSEREDPFEKPFDKSYLAVIIVPLFLIIMSLLVWKFVSLRAFIAALVFSAISAIPILMLFYTNVSIYENEHLQQMRKFHGSEHAAVKLLQKKSEKQTYEVLKTMSIYDSECGTAYAGYAIFLAALLAFLIINPLHTSFFKAIGILIGAIVLLIINIFNPYNPFKLLQRPVVAKPTDYEYKLVWEIFKRLKEIEKN